MEQNQVNNPEISITLTLAEVNKISEALSEKPLKDSIDTFMRIREQTMKQLQAMQVVAETDKASGTQ